MDINDIQELIKFVAKVGVDEVEIEQKDFKITIKSDSLARKKSKVPQAMELAPVVQPQAVIQPQAIVTPVAPSTAPPAQETNTTPPANNGNEDNYITIKSPMIGTFYRAPSPEKPAFVNVGDTINAGDVICIVEAMKLFNEIEAEVSGKIVKVLVDDVTPVEYDQPLFLVEPA